MYRKLGLEALEERQLLSLSVGLIGGADSFSKPAVFHDTMPVFTGTVTSTVANEIDTASLKFYISKWNAGWAPWQTVDGTLGATTATSVVATYALPADATDGYYAVDFSALDKAGAPVSTPFNYVLIDREFKLVAWATPGTFDISSGTFVLQDKNNSAGVSPTTLPIPSAIGFIPLAGDWDGTGSIKIGAWDPLGKKFYLATQNSAALGGGQLIIVDLSETDIPSGPVAVTGFIPVVGDWDGDGKTTVGIFWCGDTATGKNAHFWATNTAVSTAMPSVDFNIDIGTPLGVGWIPVAGDWNGAGKAVLGAFNQANSGFYLASSMTSSTLGSVSQVVLGSPGWSVIPVAQDWFGLNKATVGMFDQSRGIFFLLTNNMATAKIVSFTVSASGSAIIPVAGRWVPLMNPAAVDAVLIILASEKPNRQEL